MCGDYTKFYEWYFFKIGSPLHVRGLQSMIILLSVIVRITPACAGTTYYKVTKLQRGEDHPCMCGDYTRNNNLVLFFLGSPLHVRGLHISNCLFLKPVGITPACAGTTCIAPLDASVSQDHPCMCGDYSLRHRQPIFILGSPLHVRGLQNITRLNGRI